MHKTRIILTLLLLAALAGCLHGKRSVGPYQPTDEFAEFLDSEYTTILTLDGVSPDALEALASQFHDSRGIADVDEPYESTDVIWSNAPHRRLLLAGRAATHWFLAYEHGGRGHHHHLVIIEDSAHKPEIKLNARGQVRECYKRSRQGCHLDNLKRAALSRAALL